MKKLYIDRSGIQGKGVFAKKNIEKGKIIFIGKGKIIKFIIKSPKDSKMGPRWIGAGKDRWLDPFVENPLYFINHSCNPNAGIKGSVLFVALKNIKKGEEIFLNYSIVDEDKFWQMNCSCGAKNCRKIIRSIQFLPVKTFKKYLPYVPTYFKKVYMKHHRITP